MKRHLPLITFIILIIILSGCNPAPTKPNPGVYLEVNGQLIELKRVRGNPSTTGLPTAADLQPILKFYLPLDDVKQIQLRSLSNKLNFDTVAAKDDVYEIKPSDSLATGTYCLSLGGPLVSPSDVSYWCFQVNSGASPFGTLVAATPIVVPTIQATSAPKTSNGRIAFVSANKDGTSADIYSINNDGTGLINLTNTPANYSFLAWAPDGKQIAFLESAGIWKMNADGSARIKLSSISIDEAPRSLGWSPDGLKIMFSSNKGMVGKIYIMNADGTGLTNPIQKPASIGIPDWSPNGERVAFNVWPSGPDIYVANSDGSNVTNLTKGQGLRGFPAWSPDGKRIAFFSSRDNIGIDVYVMRDNGTEQTQLTQFSSPSAGYLHIAWSPDGTRIAFNLNSRDFNKPDTGIYIMKADGAELTKVADGGLFSWSPDGNRIAFAGLKNGKSGIFVMRVDGSGLTQLTNTSQIYYLQWQP